MAPIYEVNVLESQSLDLQGIGRRRLDLESPEQTAELDTSSYIVIPSEFTGGEYEAEVDPARLAYSPAVEHAGRSLGLTLRNTARDTLGREFVGEINWQEAMNLTQALGTEALEGRMKTDFLRLLREGASGNIKVYSVSGKQLEPAYLARVGNDIWSPTGIWRAEWFGDFYDREKLENLDEDTLMENKRLSLDSWLDNPTSQGLPREDTLEGDLYYWNPTNGAVSGFGANSGRADFDCDRNPAVEGSGLGVRSAIKRELGMLASQVEQCFCR